TARAGKNRSRTDSCPSTNTSASACSGDKGGAMRVLVLLLSLFVSGVALAQQAPAPQPAQTPSSEQNVKDQQQRPAVQPGNNAPFYREVGGGQTQYTTTSAQGRETEVLVQSWGDTWRRIRNGPVTFYGGWLVVLILAAIVAFYSVFGPVKVH